MLQCLAKIDGESGMLVKSLELGGHLELGCDNWHSGAYLFTHLSHFIGGIISVGNDFNFKSLTTIDVIKLNELSLVDSMGNCWFN